MGNSKFIPLEGLSIQRQISPNHVILGNSHTYLALLRHQVPLSLKSQLLDAIKIRYSIRNDHCLLVKQFQDLDPDIFSCSQGIIIQIYLEHHQNNMSLEMSKRRISSILFNQKQLNAIAFAFRQILEEYNHRKLKAGKIQLQHLQLDKLGNIKLLDPWLLTLQLSNEPLQQQLQALFRQITTISQHSNYRLFPNQAFPKYYQNF